MGVGPPGEGWAILKEFWVQKILDIKTSGWDPKIKDQKNLRYKWCYWQKKSWLQFLIMWRYIFGPNILDPKTLGLKKCKNEQMSLEQMLSEQMSQAPWINIFFNYLCPQTGTDTKNLNKIDQGPWNIRSEKCLFGKFWVQNVWDTWLKEILTNNVFDTKIFYFEHKNVWLKFWEN